MEIVFSDAELARVCNSSTARQERYGPEASAMLLRRLSQMAAAARLSDLRLLAAARIQACPGDERLGRLITLAGRDHLTVRPRDNPPATLADGALDEHAVRALIVTAVTIAR
ncbi:hypothetical protein ACFV4T_41280 [Streptomyces sp. NPDC059755]|uniref:hypothetical protein n=1 Tax=Streptomyces sp. NPDC059755 TaxID=3346934 RepID=UPI003654C0C7